MLAYSKPKVQKPGISKTLAHSEPEIYSESWAIQDPAILNKTFVDFFTFYHNFFSSQVKQKN